MRNLITVIIAALIGCWVHLFTAKRFIETANAVELIGALLLLAIFLVGGVHFSKRLKKEDQ